VIRRWRKRQERIIRCTASIASRAPRHPGPDSG
jgi:hypothetical protein